jgi:hypothetical protein
MKLRIKNNSLRIRLSRTEVDTLGSMGHLEDATEFVTGTFRYALRVKEGISGLQATFEDGKITMYAPIEFTKTWPGNTVVGTANEVPLPGGGFLSLLLEKDFKCIDNASEDQSDNYENPNATC